MVAASTAALTFFGLSSVTIAQTTGDTFAMDNVTSARAATEPEPATWATLAPALSLIGAGLRRRRTCTTVR